MIEHELALRLKGELAMIKHIWIEQNESANGETLLDNTDVIVETDDGAMWSASFATIPYLQRQMQMSHEVAHGIANMPPVRFVAIETPHVIVENLDQDTIEDTIDNMMTLGVFESVFALYREENAADSMVEVTVAEFTFDLDETDIPTETETAAETRHG